MTHRDARACLVYKQMGISNDYCSQFLILSIRSKTFGGHTVWFTTTSQYPSENKNRESFNLENK